MNEPAIRTTPIPGEGLKGTHRPTEMKVDFARREITGYASHFGNVDETGDVVVKGAFARTLTNQMPRNLIKFYYNHLVNIGTPVHAEEDSTGLLTVSKVRPLPEYDKYLQMALPEDRGTAHMSFAYDVKQFEPLSRDGQSPVRLLTELKLWEWSTVEWPANEMAEILGVKSLAEQADFMRELKAQMPNLRAVLAKKGFLRDSEQEFVTRVGGAIRVAVADALKALASSDSEPPPVLPDAATTPSSDPPPTPAVVDPEEKLYLGQIREHLTALHVRTAAATIRAAAR